MKGTFIMVKNKDINEQVLNLCRVRVCDHMTCFVKRPLRVMCMLTHTYKHKALRKIKSNICNHQVDCLLYS